MQENNSKDTLTDTSEPEVLVPELEMVETVIASPELPERETSSDVPVAAVVVAVPVAPPTRSVLKKYGIAALIIIIMMLGLVFLLEKEGRINTGLFASMLRNSSATVAVALVNGVKIPQADFASSLLQLTQMAASQGANTTDVAFQDELKKQAMDNLVNGQILRQAALEAGIEAPTEQVDTRLAKIEAGIGGPEALATKMGEFGISEESLRRDIENEILIQGLFDNVISPEKTPVTEEEITKIYEQSGGEKAGLPPLKDMRAQVVQKIEQNRQEQKISDYLEILRAKATIEVLI